MDMRISADNFKLFLFSIFTCLVTYGFTLINYSLCIDSETPINSDFALDLGRWGTNFIRYHIFEGHIPYFTLLLGLILLSLTAVELTKLFKLNGILRYLFCALFLSFPQMAYQLVFEVQADTIPLGFLCSILAINIFLEGTTRIYSLKSVCCFVIASLLLMFVIAIYQALAFLPIIIYLIYFFQSTYRNDFIFKVELKKGFHFIALLGCAFVLYFISVKLFCPPVEGGYLSTYTNTESQNRFPDFLKLWESHLNGRAYYGERIFQVILFLSIILVVKFAFERKLFVYRFIALFLLLLFPFLISFFITNGVNPPRIYVASGIVFAFIIVHFIRNFKHEKIVVVVCSIICLSNIYFVTQLFYSHYRIFDHDKNVATQINNAIVSKYPEFDENTNYVYFYGHFPYDYHNHYQLPKSDVFGGSFFIWDNGNNFRINNFFRFTGVAYYKMIDNQETFVRIKDSMGNMPVWPQKESVKMINNVIVVKLGNEKGLPLWVE